MATRRYRAGLAHYNPKAAHAARYRKRTAGPKQRAKLERATRARGRLPAPGTGAGRSAAKRYAPDTSEHRHLVAEATAEALGRRGHEGAVELLREYEDEHYRGLYRSRQAERVAAGTIKGRPKRKAAAKPKGEWIHVRAHRRRRPR